LHLKEGCWERKVCMKCKTKNAVVLCFAIVGLMILSCCIFVEKESSFLLPIGMLCVTIGNLIQGIFTYKQNKRE